MTTWGDMSKGNVPEGVPPTRIVSQIDSNEIQWLLEMAELGIQANVFVSDLGAAMARLQDIIERLNLS